MSDESLSELQREWRQRITSDIEGIRSQLSAIARQLSDQRDYYVTQRDHDELESRVKQIEADRQKLAGMVVVINAVIAIGVWIAGKLWK